MINVGYTVIMGSAVLSAALIARQTQRDLGLSRLERFGIGVGALCGAMIGARLPYVFADWSEFLSGWAWFGNGKTILLGLAGGYAGVEIAKWTLDIRTRTGDSFACPVAVAIAVGRLGCFVAGCCYGVPTRLPWGVVFPSVDAVPRHPTQLYEALFHAICAGALWYAQRRGWFPGHRVKLYVILYSAYRFLSEFLRPELEFWGGLTAFQWASLALMAGFAVIWYRDAARLANDAARLANDVD